MKKKGIDAYLIKETHLSRDFEKNIIKNYYLIHHGPPSQPINELPNGKLVAKTKTKKEEEHR
jgi:hypothetical protein